MKDLVHPPRTSSFGGFVLPVMQEFVHPPGSLPYGFRTILNICIHIYVYIYIHAFDSVCVCIYIYTFDSVYICVYIFGIYIYIHFRFGVYIYTHIYIYIYIYIFDSVYIYICLYTYMCIYIFDSGHEKGDSDFWNFPPVLFGVQRIFAAVTPNTRPCTLNCNRVFSLGFLRCTMPGCLSKQNVLQDLRDSYGFLNQPALY